MISSLHAASVIAQRTFNEDLKCGTPNLIVIPSGMQPLLMYHRNLLVPYSPENKPPPPFSAVDMAQTREGAYFQIHAMRLKYKPPLADSHTN